MRFSRVVRLLLVFGLLVVLLMVAIVTGKIRVAGGMVIRPIVLFSKYFRLMPYVLAQAKLETNNFKSRVYLTDHNYFGMKWTEGRRGQVATRGLLSPEGNHYARYATDSASVLDLLKWFEARKFPVSVNDAGEYARELKARGYFTSDLAGYERNLKFWLNKS